MHGVAEGGWWGGGDINGGQGGGDKTLRTSIDWRNKL